MDRGIWATWYDLDEQDRGPFREWLHAEYLPKLEKSGKYFWVANYMAVDAPLERPTADGKPNVGRTNESMPQATQNVMLVAASSPHVFLNPLELDGDQTEFDPKGMLKLRKETRHAVMVEEERVIGKAKGAENHPSYPAPAIQFGTFRMADFNDDWEAGRWYSQSRLPLFGRSEECTRARKMMVVAGWAKHGILYEFPSIPARNALWERVHKARLAGDQMLGWTIGPRTVHTPGSAFVGVRTYPPIKTAT